MLNETAELLILSYGFYTVSRGRTRTQRVHDTIILQINVAFLDEADRELETAAIRNNVEVYLAASELYTKSLQTSICQCFDAYEIIQLVMLMSR
jgi:hypothetical protein